MSKMALWPMVWGLAASLLTSCGGPSGPGELIEREVPASKPAAAVVPNASSELRFRGEMPQSAQPGPADPTPQDLASLFAYDLPPGWEAQDPTQFRIINLRLSADPRAECYLSILPSAAGGLTANVNRWRDQMDLPHLDVEAVAALPRRSLLSSEGSLIDFEGTFSGMGGPAQEGWRMLGLIVPIPGQTLFFKMTGPSDVLAQELQAFEDLCSSLRPSGVLPGGGEPQPPAPATGGLTWTPHQDWMDQGPRTMRLISYQVGAASECYLALARGDRLSNYNRWRGQAGQDPMTNAEVDALETVTVLGKDCPLLEVTGEFRGMSGGAQADTTLLGIMCPLGADSLFVKMVGPAHEVAVARDDFLAFCASIAQE